MYIKIRWRVIEKKYDVVVWFLRVYEYMCIYIVYSLFWFRYLIYKGIIRIKNVF